MNLEKDKQIKLAICYYLESNGIISLREGSAKYGVNKDTLRRKLNQIKQPAEEKIDDRGKHLQVLTLREEGVLKWFVEDSARKGNPVSKLSLCENAKILIDNRKKQVGENIEIDETHSNKPPGRDWCKGFLLRHNLTERISQALTPAASNISEQNIRNWFSTTKADILKEVPSEVLIAENRNFNCDESFFNLSVALDKVVVPKGTQHVSQIVKNEKEGKLY
jgi:hypothetical protein